MTANVMLGDRQKHLAAGANDHIAKPIDMEEMITTLAKWITPLEPSAPGGMQKTEARQTQDFLPNLPGVRVVESVKNMGGNLSLYYTLIKNFSNNQRDVADRMRAALAAGDQKTAGRLAHTLRGLAGTIGAEALGGKSRELELATQQDMDETVESLLQDVELELTSLFVAIDRALQLQAENAAEGTDPTKVSIDHEALGRLIGKAKKELEEFDSTVSETLEQIERMVSSDTAMKMALQAVARAIDKYDYELGLDELENWEKVIKNG
jgi:HPt (histidine-containing phosphotransfer) domain-containing protein